MSYLVLARKWRPQTFEHVVAQKHAIQALQNAIRLRRLPHALLLCGSRGIGKTTIARLIAKTINCEQRDPNDEQGPAEPCNQCSMCKEITIGRSVDVLEIDGASNRSIDDIRELRDNVQYPPTRGRRKVYIIDEVHMLTREAFNALLKTLEEPPEHVLFTFATTEPHKIPITILSRCQRFDLKRISITAMSHYLGEIAAKEEIHLSEASLMMITRAADGGMRDALSLMDQVIAFGGEHPSDEDVAQAIGALDRTLLLDIGRALLQRDINALLHHIEDLFSYAYDLRHLTQELAGLLRDLMVVRVCKNPSEVIDLAASELATVQELAAQEAPERIQQMFRLLTAAAEDIAHASHPRLILEMTLIQMARIEPVRPFDEILEQLHILENQLQENGPQHSLEGSPPVPKLSKSPSAPSRERPQPQKPAQNTAQSVSSISKPPVVRPQQSNTQNEKKRVTPPPASQRTSVASEQRTKNVQPPPTVRKEQKAPVYSPPTSVSSTDTASALQKKLNAQLERSEPSAASTKVTDSSTTYKLSKPKTTTPRSTNSATPELIENEFSKLQETPEPYDPQSALTTNQWEFLVEGISESKQFLSGPLQVARFRSLDPGRVLLIFQPNQGLHLDTISKSKNKEFVETFFAEQGYPIQLEAQVKELREDEEKQFHPSVIQLRKRRYTALISELRQELHEDPRVQQLFQLFPGTELVEIFPLAEEAECTQDEVD